MHSRQRHSCWGRQGETDRLRQECIPRHEGRSWHAKVGRQATKQRKASRLAEGSGQLKQAKIDVVRER
jgi:hypothetical protein